ncbi:hypothetical protein DSO57_1036768 [Entomophthora muscae]|uniref:Uncharacterized protein n=1 Tax=Entomophthora muscae TaxID=34485 RepID=A0ACC2TA35_9FUNG|nr:hypothetical protein DSO57_1036768 [Entomophthora muscae]
MEAYPLKMRIVEVAAHHPLDICDYIGDVPYIPEVRPFANHSTRAAERHARRGDMVALFVVDNLAVSIAINSRAGVGCSEIDPDNML